MPGDQDGNQGQRRLMGELGVLKPIIKVCVLGAGTGRRAQTQEAKERPKALVSSGPRNVV